MKEGAPWLMAQKKWPQVLFPDRDGHMGPEWASASDLLQLLASHPDLFIIIIFKRAILILVVF